MAPSLGKNSNYMMLICGEDEFTVKRRARQIYQQWCEEVAGLDHEIINASAATVAEAVRALAKLREALQTLPLFSSAKVVWFQDCNFLSDEQPASETVTDNLADLAQELQRFTWTNIRLLISSGKVDKRRVFYKTIEKIGSVESCSGWSTDDRNWVSQVENWVRNELKAFKKGITDEALAELIGAIGPNSRQLNNELDKLALFVGDRASIEPADVNAVVSRQKQARAFALGDALGDRNLPGLLKALDEELWELRSSSQGSAIGLLYGLVTKVRVLILLKGLFEAGWLKEENNYSRFKTQLDRLPKDFFPDDKRLNPLAMHPYVIYKAQSQTRLFSMSDLVRIMELLLECNRRLVSSGLDEALVLQQTVVQIFSSPGSQGARQSLG